MISRRTAKTLGLTIPAVAVLRGGLGHRVTESVALRLAVPVAEAASSHPHDPRHALGRGDLTRREGGARQGLGKPNARLSR